MSTKTSIASTVRDRLRGAILSGEIAPGTRLRLEQLGDDFGVSLSPLREALLRLAGEGLVTSKDQRGFAVAAASLADFAEVTALRVLLEPYALRLAIAHGSLEWEERLVGIFHRLSRVEADAHHVEQLRDWEAAHRAFHFALLEGSSMPLLLEFCGNLYDRADRYRRLHLAQGVPQAEARREHRAILDATLARDAERACAALVRHIERSSAVVKRFLKDRGAGP